MLRMVEEASRQAPEAAYRFILDCGEDRGAFFAAIREGAKEIRAEAEGNLSARLQEIASASGAILHIGDTNTFDLLDIHNPETRVTQWLANA